MKLSNYQHQIEPVWLCVETVFDQIKFFFFTKIKYDLYFLDRFDMLISKMIFKK